MKAIKKINHNAAICLDGNGNEVVVFGRGLGFPEMPYEITDLSLIDKTFYGISSKYIGLIKDIGNEIFDISTQIVEYATLKIDRDLSPNLVFTLADHINFSVDRYHKNILIKAPYVGDIKNLYETEYKIGLKSVKYINKKLNIHLSKDEAISIALHLINSESFETTDGEKIDEEKIINGITDIISRDMDYEADRDSINFARFKTHLLYLLKRLNNEEPINTSNEELFEKTKDNYPIVYKCAVDVGKYITEITSKDLNDEEIMYLMLHINRMCTRK